jgi:tetratricopeptide (TPR) repeat protein
MKKSSSYLGKPAHRKRDKRVFLFVVLFVFTSSSSWAWREAYKEASRFMKVGAYEQAIEELEKALASGGVRPKTKTKLEGMLSESKMHAARAIFHRAERFSEENRVSKAVELYQKAASYDPDNEAYRKRLDQERGKLRDIEERVEAAYALGVEENQWDEALAQLESYRIYESSFPEIADRIKSFREEAGTFFIEKSQAHLLNERYAPAYRSMQRALKFTNTEVLQKQRNALHHLVMSEEAWTQRRYLKAYEEIMKGLEFEQESTELLAFRDRLLEEWSGILYNEAVRAQNDGRLADAKVKLTELSRYNPGFMNTEELLLEVTGTLASDLYLKAEQMMNSGSRERIGTALAYYLIVQEEHSELFPDIGEKVDEAKRLLRKELEFRIALDFRNSSAEPGAGGLVKEQILERMQNAPSLKHITILDRESIDDILREQGLGQAFLDETTAIEVKKIKGIQAGIRAEVVRLEVKESGRDRPSYGSARYVSGTRYVPNPAYQQAQADVQVMQQRVLQAQQDLNAQKQQQNQMMRNQQGSTNQVSGLIAGLGQLSTALSEQGVTRAKNDLASAQNRLARTPMQIEEDIYSDYRYEIFDLKLQGEVVIALKVINYTTSEISEVHTIKKRDEAVDRYIPGDPGKNVESDPIELPTMDAFKSQLVSKAIDETFHSLADELSGISYSHYEAGRKYQDLGLEEDAIESYMRFIYSAPDLRDKRVHEANEYIYDQLGLRVIIMN